MVEVQEGLETISKVEMSIWPISALSVLMIFD